MGLMAARSDPRATSIAALLVRICSASSLRPGGSSSDWKPSDGELLRLERKRSAIAGVIVPWETLRRRTLFSANLEIEDRHREHSGDAGAVSGADPIEQEPTLVGGGLGVSFGNTQAGLRSISVQDGVRMSASIDYLKATDDRWRSGWDVASSVYRSFSIMDDRGSTGARGNRAGCRTTGTGGRPSDRRRRWNDRHRRRGRHRIRGAGLPAGIRRRRSAVERAQRIAPADRACQPGSRGMAALFARPVGNVVHRQRRGSQPRRSARSPPASVNRRRVVERRRSVLVCLAPHPHGCRCAPQESGAGRQRRGAVLCDGRNVVLIVRRPRGMSSAVRPADEPYLRLRRVARVPHVSGARLGCAGGRDGRLRPLPRLAPHLLSFSTQSRSPRRPRACRHVGPGAWRPSRPCVAARHGRTRQEPLFAGSTGQASAILPWLRRPRRGSLP